MVIKKLSDMESFRACTNGLLLHNPNTWHGQHVALRRGGL